MHKRDEEASFLVSSRDGTTKGSLGGCDRSCAEAHELKLTCKATRRGAFKRALSCTRSRQCNSPIDNYAREVSERKNVHLASTKVWDSPWFASIQKKFLQRCAVNERNKKKRRVISLSPAQCTNHFNRELISFLYILFEYYFQNI